MTETPEDIQWNRFPVVAQTPHGRTWLTIQANLGLAANTIDAYGRALEDFLTFGRREGLPSEGATREHVARYVRDLSSRPNPRRGVPPALGSSGGLSNATMQQRLTAVRLWYDYLVEERVRETNPVGRGRYTLGKGFGGQRERGLIPRYKKLPWIPIDEEWDRLLTAAKEESLRNRLMLAFSYDAALRREEVCSLLTSDIDPALRQLRIRAETTKNRQERSVPFSQATGELYAAYLHERRKLSQSRGPLFVSESRRNRAQPISIWTWSKVVKRMANQADVPAFTTHTPRHLCLTDLAREGWDVAAIALFAGHRSIESTLRYIHLSGDDLAKKLQKGMADIHGWRMKMLQEALL